MKAQLVHAAHKLAQWGQTCTMGPMPTSLPPGAPGSQKVGQAKGRPRSALQFSQISRVWPLDGARTRLAGCGPRRGSALLLGDRVDREVVL